MARPTQEIFLVTPYTDPSGQTKQRWVKIGVAFSHRDNRGVSLKFHLTPSTSDFERSNVVLRDVNDRPRTWCNTSADAFIEEEHRCDDADCCIGKGKGGR